MKISTEQYSKAYYIRAVEEFISQNYHKHNEMRCPVHLSVGQEAVAVSICEFLSADDKIYTTHRSHAHYLAKGGDLFKMISEICGRSEGCVSGRGGSMHLMDKSVGVMPSIPIVGSSVPLGVGQAWADKMNAKQDITVVFIGDGAVEEGSFHESANFAALLDLPVLFVCENNFYSVYTPLDERQPDRPLTDLAKAHGIKTYSANGYDFDESMETASKAVSHVKNGHGPCFIEFSTYRWLEHCGPGNDDHLGYRPQGDLEKWQQKDPLAAVRQALIESGASTEAQLSAMEQAHFREVEEIYLKVLDLPLPAPDLPTSEASADHLNFAPNAPLNCALSEPRKTDRLISYAQAVNEAICDSMETDSNVILFGEGVQDPSSMWGTTKGIAEKFGTARTVEMPIAELALTGVAIGAAISGMRPVMSLQRVEFSMLAFEQLFNNAAKIFYGSAGQLNVPIFLRLIIGRGWGQGPQHAQSLESVFAHFPGLKVIMPTFASDVKGMVSSAIADNNPVISLEHRWLHNTTSYVPEVPYRHNIDKPHVVRAGTDVTIVATSLMVLEALNAAETLEKYTEISCEVVDLRVIRPLDTAPIVQSVKRTGRLLCIDTGWQLYGVGGEIIAQVTERAFSQLTQKPERLAIPDHPVPSSRGLVKEYYPDATLIAAKIGEMLDASGEKMGKALTHLNQESKQTPIDIPDPSFKGPF